MMDNFDIAYKIRESNRALRSLFKDTYEEQVKEVKDCIAEVMKAKKKDVLPAAIDLMEAAKEMGKETHIVWFCAAAYDMIIENANPLQGKYLTTDWLLKENRKESAE